MDRSDRGHHASSGDRNIFPRRFLQSSVAAALACGSIAAHAISLGDLEVRSHLGQPLDATIALRGAALDTLEDACFAIVPPSSGGIPIVEHGEVKLERAGGNALLRVRSATPLVEPALMLGIRAACPGQQGVLLREYPVLLDPVRVEPRAAISPPVVAEAVANRAVAAAPGAPQMHAAPSAPAHAAQPRPVHRHRASSRSAARRHPAHAAPFLLKLSGPRVDLAPSRELDEASRARLRERLAVLQSDDDTATLLAMRDRMSHLESEVAALQLRVSQLGSVAAQANAPQAKPPQAKPAQAKPAEAGQASVAPRWARAAGLAFAVLLALAAAGLAWALRRRAKRDTFPEEEAAGSPMQAARAIQPEAPREPPRVEPAVPQPALAAPIVAAEAREAPAEGLELVPIDDTDAVIRAARLYYEEGALLRAVQVLQLAVDRHPERVRPWLALLELLRREGLVVDHAELAARFHGLHGADEAWRKVQFFGREIDPANPLYRDAQSTPLQFDPVAESWLEMPASFDEALATELRHSLVRSAARAHPSDSPSHAVG